MTRDRFSTAVDKAESDIICAIRHIIIRNGFVSKVAFYGMEDTGQTVCTIRQLSLRHCAHTGSGITPNYRKCVAGKESEA
jgi:hypothetical protein